MCVARSENRGLPRMQDDVIEEGKLVPLWELHCPLCRRSSWDGLDDDTSGDPCPCCGQLPAKE